MNEKSRTVTAGRSRPRRAADELVRENEKTEDRRGGKLSIAEIAALIRRQIDDGEFSAGERLHEERLAREFDVARPRVREALRQLAAQNIVTLQYNKGASVLSMEHEEIRDLVRIRTTLWGLIVEFATERASDAELAEFEGALAGIANDANNPDFPPEKFMDSLFDLQARIAKSSRVPRLSASFDTMLSGVSVRYMQVLAITEEWRMKRVEAWRRVISAMLTRDTATARRVAEEAHEEGNRDALILYKTLGDIGRRRKPNGRAN
jgi:DNA-binding GntR family transcriptional regulator